MPSVKQLQEERAPIGVQIRKMADVLQAEGRDFNAEERSQWERLNTEFNQKSDLIEAQRRAAEVGAILDGPGDRRNIPGLEDTVPRSMRNKATRRYRAEAAEEMRSLALQAWCRRQHGFDLTDAHKRACRTMGLNPNRKVLEIRLDRHPGKGPQSRAMSAQQPSSGASLIAGGKFAGAIEKALKDYSGPREVADVLRTDDGAPMPWPTSDDTSNEGELIGENREVSTQDAKVGTTLLSAYKYSSKMVKVPSELMDDTEFDLDTFLGELLAQRAHRSGADPAVHRRLRFERASREPQAW